ncbi:Nucleotide-binding, alpha-beta plait [Penicillium camemberti]|uniref:Nucleotide-binding, alpha-beta plait n=1 Tax=Penicillium camemberti (strain FM 013) TaxID=1429867 RepID=A0A0G4PJ06_PENC3|nr:Nucleotide-binding, alpha-beta plait [Penicillium camemberti]
MSANLDKSLDDLVGSRRQTARGTTRRRGGSRRAATKPSAVGGVKKSTKAAPKAAHPAPVAQTGSSKILVSGLPSDVSEANVKEYFNKSAGPVRRVMLTYNQNGTSRGIASIQFVRADTAAKATKELNGLLVDGRPMKIEVVYDASHVPAVPAAKPLTERIAQKARPKSAAATKAKETKTPATEKGTRRGKGPARPRGRNAGRGKPKTVEELDAEMVDYFSTDAPPAEGTAPVNGTVPQASASQDIGMADEIS